MKILYLDYNGVLQNPAPDIYTWEYADYSVRYRIRYWMSDYAEQEEHLDLECHGGLGWNRPQNRPSARKPL